MSSVNFELNDHAIGSIMTFTTRMLNSKFPIDVNKDEETCEHVTVNGQSGCWLNKKEVNEWKGEINISEYPFLEDSDPVVISKKNDQEVELIQELCIRYLRPPTPEPPGDIIIFKEQDYAHQAAPPVIIRQQPPRPETPKPLVIREAPPPPPPKVQPKRIVIAGKRVPPPPRKVIIERLPPLPAKPQNVIIERWLPYAQPKRKVVFERSVRAHQGNQDGNYPSLHQELGFTPIQKNLVIQWEEPTVKVSKQVKYLGTVKADPIEYLNRYGSDVTAASDLPAFVTDIPTPSDVGVLAADLDRAIEELIGDLEALKYVDLEVEGLSGYRQQLEAAGIISGVKY